MIKNIDKTGKTNSLYICDMCGKIVDTINRVGVHVKFGTDKSILKKWDLCSKCYIMLEKSIGKYKKRKTEKFL